jgi:hypothetical protein
MELFDKEKLTAYLLDPKAMNLPTLCTQKEASFYAKQKCLDMINIVTCKSLALKNLIFSMEMWLPSFSPEDINADLAYRFINFPNSIQTMGHGYLQSLKMLEAKFNVILRELNEIYNELGGLNV